VTDELTTEEEFVPELSDYYSAALLELSLLAPHAREAIEAMFSMGNAMLDALADLNLQVNISIPEPFARRCDILFADPNFQAMVTEPKGEDESDAS
jgi:hypothetical protein